MRADRPRIDRPKGGLRRANRFPVLRGQSGASLTIAAEESLFRVAEFLFEGKRDHERLFASFMMKVSLERLRTIWRTIPEPAELRSVLEGSVRVRIRIARLALREVVARYPTERLGPVEMDASFIVDSESVRIDLDLEAERILLAQAVDSE